MADNVPTKDRERFDLPPCVMDESGPGGKPGEPDDPLYDERDGLPKLQKHAMHDKEKEE